ncbi:unnamed protein product [Soboliphyme baturini]|uniref:FIT family protein n=1 Tax=Soboliphyme baturini TaxID=241478 RepID=A0A183IYQ1_9BILA|nr:unnamed protein product [Soboliphyme baturini]
MSPVRAKQKKSLPPPTTISNFVLACVLHLCRKYVLFDIDTKVGVYLITVMCGSFLADFCPLSRNHYLANKRNLFNVCFVKWSWLWTFCMVGSFIYLSSMVYCRGDLRTVFRHCSRLIVSTLVWWVFTTSFVEIERRSGFCLKSTFVTKEQCIMNGSRWIAFDISGHCFLMIYCCLVISEELKIFRNWDRNVRICFDRHEEPSDDEEVYEGEVTTTATSYRVEAESTKTVYLQNTYYLRILFVVISMLHLVWDCMLVSTVLFFHSFAQKFVAALLAVAAWFVTYRLWYKQNFSPGLPGEGVFM